MTDFLLSLPADLDLKEIITVPDRSADSRGQSPGDKGLLYTAAAEDWISVRNNKQEEFYFSGDFIIPGKYKTGGYFQYLADNWLEQDLKYINGLFYVIYFSPRTSTLRVYNSVFSILPVYYYTGAGHIFISSSVNLLRRYVRATLTLNGRFLLEQILFAYPFLNATVFSEIQVVPSNCCLEYHDRRLQCLKHTQIEAFFQRELITWKKAQDGLSASFIELVNDYFPDEGCAISFTSGFDGRTLVACAKKAGKKFSTFSFGAHDNPDVTIPAAAAAGLGLEHRSIILDADNYIHDHFVADGAELIELSALNSNYLYVQFLYSAKILSASTRHLVTGYCGSELFRALHVAGAMTPPELINCLTAADDSWVNFLKNSLKLQALQLSGFDAAFDDLVESIKQYRSSRPDGLNLNQKLYTYIFEEIFRKFFGSLIVPQLKYLHIRLPYLNFKFVGELLKTELAGVNNPFFTHNPLQRFKGQLLYAQIIKQTAPEMLHLLTGKGYRPADLLSLRGRLKIVYPFLRKRLGRRIFRPNLDNLAILSALQYNKRYFGSLIDRSNFHNRERLHQALDSLSEQVETNRDNLAIALSQLQYINSLNN